MYKWRKISHMSKIGTEKTRMTNLSLCRVSPLPSNNPEILSWTTNQAMFLEANLRPECTPNLKSEFSTQKKVKAAPAQNLKNPYTPRLCPVTKSLTKWLKWLKNCKTTGIFGHNADKKKTVILKIKWKMSRTHSGLIKTNTASYQEGTNRLPNILSNTLWNPVKPS